jgi:hypothetical protein
LDEQARRAIVLCRFPAIRNPQSAIDNPMVWGLVTLNWGNDVARPAATPTKTPAP